MPETKSIKGVEIFSAGNWNGDEYSTADLHEMVKAFSENSIGARPHLKLGHDDKQKLLQNDGLPAAGWIEKLYVIGDKLVADFVDIPAKIYDLIKNKAYRKVSSEIFWNIKIGEKTYKRMLAAVALLGADTPGVMNLNDILSLYKKHDGNYEKLSIDNVLEFTVDSSESTKKGAIMPEKSEKEIKLEYEVEQKDLELKAATEKLEAAEKLQREKDAEVETLRKFKADAEAREAQLVAEKETQRIEGVVNQMVSDKLCTPAMKPYVLALLGPEKKEYSVKTDKDEKKLSKEEMFKETLKLFKAAADVNFEENSSAERKEFKSDDEQMDKMAKEYAEKNKCSYGQALKEVMKQNKKK